MDKSIDTSSITTSRHKIVFVGDVSVGKTSIMNRFIEGTFNEIYDPSIGVDFHAKTISFRDEQIKLQFWDSAGQEKYKSLIPTFVRGASVIFIIFDKSRKESFNNLPYWIKFIKNICTDSSLLVLCGNKTDLNSEITPDVITKFAKEERLFYYEVSALKNDGITKMMYSVISELQIFNDYNLSKKEIALELEQHNQPNLNISVLDYNREDELKNNNENKDENYTIKITPNTKLPSNKSRKCKC